MSNKDADPILLELVVRVLECDVPDTVSSLRELEVSATVPRRRTRKEENVFFSFCFASLSVCD